MKAKIRLAFRIVIDQNSQHVWDKYVFEDTYFEYKIQHQLYDDQNNPSKHYWELLEKNPDAKRIAFVLSASADNYVKQLNGEIKSLPDVLGNTFYPYEYFKLDLISSHIEDKGKHKIGLTFFTPELLLLNTIDGKYLLSKDTNVENGYEIFMFPFHPQVAIAYYEEL